MTIFFIIVCFHGIFCGKDLPGCEIFQDGKCKGDEIDMPTDFIDRNWQTPLRGEESWLPGYQDYSHLKAWAHLEYAGDRQSCIVTIQTQTKDNSTHLTFLFDGEKQDSGVKKYDSGYAKILSVQVQDDQGRSISLPTIDFLWNVPKLKDREGDYRNGQKGAIVELFGWPDADVEKECETIAQAGYLGVKLFPHHEQLMSVQPFNDELNPWYFMYQPVSYKLEGRMGTRDDLRSVIKTCRALGLRVYADAVVNHMTGAGNDQQMHRVMDGVCKYWPGKNSSFKPENQRSPFFTHSFNYKENPNSNLPPSQEFPGVPYGPLDFHCERPLNSWTSPLDLNAGWLVGLTDLHTGKDHVRERIADYWVDLLSVGFSGFRIDAFKHICPDDMTEIVTKFKRNLGGSLPEDFFFWGELLIGGEHDMLLVNEDSGYNFGKYLENKFLANGFTEDEIDKLKLWSSWYPKEPDADGDKVSRVREVIQNDDHDQQVQGSTSRDMGDKGSVLVIARDVDAHRNFEKTLFDNPFGVRDNQHDWPIRCVLSSFWFTAPSGAMGPPDGLSDCKLCKVTCEGCRTVEYQRAYVQDACAYDGREGGNPYTRVHRDRDIILSMRNWMNLPTNVTNGEIGIPERC